MADSHARYRRYEDRICKDCDLPWRVRVDAKSRTCPPCMVKFRAALTAQRHAENRPELEIDRNCKQCGVIFTKLKKSIKPFASSSNSTGEFCSRDCFTEWQRENWEEHFGRSRRKKRRQR